MNILALLLLAATAQGHWEDRTVGKHVVPHYIDSKGWDCGYMEKGKNGKWTGYVTPQGGSYHMPKIAGLTISSSTRDAVVRVCDELADAWVSK
jgi:hypothetical protein